MRINYPVRAGILFSLSLASSVAQTPTSRIVGAANAFLSTLEDKQRQNVLFAFDDEQQRKRWSNLPVAMVPRSGLSMGEMTSAQRTAAMALVASALSPRGFEKVQQIVDADEVLKTNDGNGRGRGPAGNAPAGPGNGPPQAGGNG